MRAVSEPDGGNGHSPEEARKHTETVLRRVLAAVSTFTNQQGHQDVSSDHDGSSSDGHEQ